MSPALTTRPLADVNKHVKPTIPFNEVLQRMNSLTEGGTPITEAARIIFRNSVPKSKRGNNYASAASLAASIFVERKKLTSTATKTTRRNFRRKAATAPQTDGLREHLARVLDLPTLDEKTKLTVIRAMLA